MALNLLNGSSGYPTETIFIKRSVYSEIKKITSRTGR